MRNVNTQYRGYSSIVGCNTRTLSLLAINNNNSKNNGNSNNNNNNADDDENNNNNNNIRTAMIKQQ